MRLSTTPGSFSYNLAIYSPMISWQLLLDDLGSKLPVSWDGAVGNKVTLLASLDGAASDVAGELSRNGQREA
jgi:hypothetical protein